MKTKGFLGAWLLCCGLTTLAADFQSVILEAARQHPSYDAYRAARTAAGGLSAIEKARRYPRIDGLASRVDGRSSLVTTPSAWQTGVSLSYPVYDHGRQDANDRISDSQARVESGVAMLPLEQATADLAAAYVRMWESTHGLTELDRALAVAGDFVVKVQAQLKSGEQSQLTYVRVLKRSMELKSRRLEMQQRFESALSVWRAVGLERPKEWIMPEVAAWGEGGLPHGKLMKIQAELDKLDAESSFAKLDEGPSVELQASYLTRKYANGVSPWTPYQTWQITSTYPFFDGGLREARTSRQLQLKASKEAEQLAELRQVDAEDGRLKSEILASQAMAKESESQCELQAKLAVQLQERFQLGRGEAQDTIEAQLAATECRLLTWQLKASAYLKYNDWMRVNGIWAARMSKEAP